MIDATSKLCIVKAPFRLDLVMGGVSDLDFWNDKNGDSVSISCILSNASLEIKGERIAEPNIKLFGFWPNGESFIIPIESDVSLISKHPPKFRLALSAAFVGIEIAKAHYSSFVGGIEITNDFVHAKGMGGSSAIAGCIISLIYYIYSGSALGFNELVDSVIAAEKYAEIGGGWEDIAGIFFEGINRVKYRPQCASPKLSIERIPCDKDLNSLLENNLLIFNSLIDASTAKILNAAESLYNQNPQLVIKYSEMLSDECELVTKALYSNNIAEIGRSLSRQRSYWNIITNGFSVNLNIQETMQTVEDDIYGYKEAGAGGGGTVLVMCKPERTQNVERKLIKGGYILNKWSMSRYGIK